MHKILVIASTDYIVQFANDFKKSGLQFDFLVTHSKMSYDFGRFENQSVNVDSELIPLGKTGKSGLLTPAQNQKKNKISLQIKQLEHILFQNFKYFKRSNLHKSVTNNHVESSQVWGIDQVVDFKLNQKEKKIYLEVQQSGVFSYDHVFIEESFLNLSRLNEKFKSHELYEFKTQQVFQFVGLQFKMNENLGHLKFWLMIDSHYNSIYDNFYFLSTHDLTVDVWCWIPVQQLKNPTTLKYFSDRVQKHLELSLNFIKLELISDDFILQPLNTYLPLQSHSENLVTFIPHFHFYSPVQITECIFTLTDLAIKKLKIKKEHLQKTQNEDSL